MSWTTRNAEMRDQLRVMNNAIPEVTKGFGVLSKAAKEAKVLDVKTLEFVALGIAIADRCDACIGFHVEALAKTGGTRDELGDVLGMAVQMGGGPSLMYAAKALAPVEWLPTFAWNERPSSRGIDAHHHVEHALYGEYRTQRWPSGCAAGQQNRGCDGSTRQPVDPQS